MATTDTPEPADRAAAKEVVSLAQVLLAPLDALFQAQVHAGRSFLNFLLQLSYEDKPKEREKATAQADADAAPVAPSPHVVELSAQLSGGDQLPSGPELGLLSAAGGAS